MDSIYVNVQNNMNNIGRDPIHNGPTEKCSLIDINTWINVTSNNISSCERAEFNHFSTKDDKIYAKDDWKFQ